MHSVLERLVDPWCMDEPTEEQQTRQSVTIFRESETYSGKCLYAWSKQAQGNAGDASPQRSFDFLNAFGGRDEDGNPQLAFYPNLAM